MRFYAVIKAPDPDSLEHEVKKFLEESENRVFKWLPAGLAVRPYSEAHEEVWVQSLYVD